MDRTDPSVRTVVNGAHWGTYEADVVNGTLVRTRPAPHDPDPSPMVTSIAQAVNHVSRVARPAVRKGWLERREKSDRTGRGREPFVEIEWDEALGLVAGEIDRVRKTHGNSAIFGATGWASAGRLHNVKSLLGRFFNPLGGFVQQTTNWSFGAASILIPRVVGTMSPVTGPMMPWRLIAEHTKLIVMFGGVPAKNAQVNEGGIVRHRTMGALRDVAAKGVEVVYLSPLREDMDNAAATWLPLRPSTDAAAMLGIAHTLVAEGLHDRAFPERYCTGFERFRAYLLGETDGKPKDAEWAAGITGVPAEALRGLARRMAANRTMIMLSWSAQRADHGEQPCWLTVTLAAMLGQIGLPGGGFGIGYGAIDGLGHGRQPIPTAALPVPPNPITFACPVARITDMLLKPGETFDFNGRKLTYPDIRLAYWAGGNPFHHNPDLNRVMRSWQQPETIVVHEPWWTPAARHADIVLPTSVPLERNDLGWSYWDNAAYAMQQAIAPRGEARSDFAIFQALAKQLGTQAAFDEGRGEIGWVEYLYETARQKVKAAGTDMPPFTEFWQAGRHEFAEPAPDENVPFADFRADPDAAKLRTPSGRIEIFSETIAGFGYDDCPGHPMWFEPREWLGADLARTYPLHMISNQPKARLHSQMDMTDLAQGTKVAGREPISMHPADAAARGLKAGDVVRVFNGRGQCLAGLKLNDALLRGVVQLSPGAWYDPAEPGVPGSLEQHGNANVLTRDGGTSKLAQCGVQQSVLVQVEAWTGPVPPIAAFEPPQTVHSQKY